MRDTTLTFEREDLVFAGPNYPIQDLWLLRGPAGVIQFKVGRHRKTPGACDTCAKFRDISHFDRDGNCWSAWDLGYHSPIPRYEGQEPTVGNDKVCEILKLESDCYYDGTGLGAGELLNAFLAGGQDQDWLRSQLESWYQTWLVDEGDSFASPATAIFAAFERMAGE